MLRKKEIHYKQSVLNTDSYDKRRFNELLKHSKGLQEMRKDGERVPHFTELMGDVWSSFYKNEPELKDDIPKTHHFNKQMMDRVLNDSSFNQYHDVTRLNDLMSAFYSITFSENIFKWIEEMRKQDDSLDQLMDQIQEQGDGHTEDSSEQQEELQDQFNQKMQEKLEDSGNQISQMMNKAMNEAKEQHKNMDQVMEGLGAGTGDPDYKKMPISDKFKLADAMKKSRKFKEIADWAGRFKAIARSKQKIKHKETVLKSGIVQGNDPERILPSEIANLAVPHAKLDFLKRFAEGQTMQFDKKGKENLGKGPIVLCLDESGSMSDMETESKGYVLAMMAIAKKQKRDFALVRFSTDCKTTIYKKGKITTDEMIRFADRFMNGGTTFYRPLRESMRLFESQKFKNGDLIFVTDGSAQLDHQFIETIKKKKEKIQFKVMAILIGNQTTTKSISTFSDEIIESDRFLDEGVEKTFTI